MNEKQRLFADEYLTDFNATQAAIRAGYSEKTAAVQGARLLRNVNIKKYIQKMVKEREDELIASQEEVLQTLTEILRRKGNDSVVVKAAELLGKYHILWTDKLRVEGEQKVIIVDDISGDQDA